jgi:hypothetical protein
MLLGTAGNWAIVLQLIAFPLPFLFIFSSRKEWDTPILLGALQGANLNHWLLKGPNRVAVFQPSNENRN